MPVEDHPVHPTTVDKGQYGCHNRPAYKTWYWGKRLVKIFPRKPGKRPAIGIQVMCKVAFSTTRPDCVYGANGGDFKCAGCCHLKSTKNGESHNE